MPDTGIVEIYKGVKIRHCNRVVLKFGIADYKKIIDSVDSTDLSIGKILAYSGQPCDRCKGLEIVVFNKKNEQVGIKKGMLRVPENNGVNIIENNKRRSTV